nr:MAG TPA: nuclease [Caudoviricetes sp.]
MASSSEIKKKWSKVHTTAKNVPVYAGTENSRELSEDEEIERRWQSNDSTARVGNSAVVNESMARTAAVNRLRAQQRQEMSRALGGSGEDSGNFRKGLQSGAAQRQLADTAQTLREQPYRNRLSITGSVAGDAQAMRFGRTGILDLPRQKSTPQTAREAAVQQMMGSGTDGLAARKDGGKAAKVQQDKKDGALAYLAKSAGTGAVSGFANVGSNLIDNDQSARELIARVHDAADGEDARKLARKQNEAYWKNKVRPASEGGNPIWYSLTADEQEKLRNAGPYSTVSMKRANSERDVISGDETMRGALGIEQGGRLAGMYQQEQGKTGALRVAGDVVSAVGGMAPNMAASAVGGPAAGFAALYASAAGASAQEARDDGADTLTAGLAGALSGGVEIATEKMFDGIPGLRGEQYASISNAVDGAVNRIFKTATGRRLANRAVNMAGEGLEEYVSDVAGGYISQLYQEDDRSFAQRLADPDAWYSFLIGSLMSAAMSGPVNAVNDSLAQRTGKSVQAQQMTDAVLEVAERQGGEAAELAGTMRQQQAAGKKFTPTDLGYLFNALDENGRAEIMDRVVNQDTISEDGQAAGGLPSSAAAAAPSPEGEGLGELPSSTAGDTAPAAAEEARNLSGEKDIQKQAAEMARAALAEQEARRQEQAFTQPLIRQVQQETAEMAGGETEQGQQREAGLASAAAEKPSTSGEGSEALRRIAAQRNMVAGGMTVDEAEQAYNARQAAQKNVGEVQKIAESGIYNDAMNAALVENYRGGSVDTYVQAMSGLYNAGRTGSLTFEQGVRAVAPAAAVVNNETALRAAYEAGRSTVTAAEPMAAPGVSGNPAITMRGTTPESTSTPLQALQLAAMKLGTNVTIAGELDDGNGNAVNGSYNATNNEISLSEKSVNSYQTALHETAHYIQQNNPEGWAELKRAALAFYTEKVGMTEAQDKVFKAYENAYGTDTGLYDEVAADLLSGIMSTDDGVGQYCDYILTADQYTEPQKRTILQTLRDAIGQLIESIKNVLRGGDATLGAAEGRKLAERAENLQEAAGIIDEYLDALDAAKNNAREIGKQKNVQVEQKGEQKNKYSYVGAQGQNVDRDTAGEVEARDVQKRMNYTAEQRRAEKPDTGNGDTVFAVNGDSFSKNNVKFSMDVPVEETKDLVAVHNVDERALERSLELGGLPMPSIAVIKAEQGHSKYGPISLVFGKDTIDPQRNSENKVYGGDGYTPTAPQIDYKIDAEKARQVERKIQLLSDKVAGGIFGRGALLRAHNVEGTTDMDTRTLAALLSNDDTARAAYLADQGKTLEPVKMEKVWSRYGNETVQKVIDKVGVQKLAETEVAFQTTGVVPDGVEDAVRSVLRDHYRKTTDGMLQRQAARKGWDADTIAQKREERINRSMENNVTWFTIHDLIDSAWNMYQDGGETKGEVDRMATSEKLRESVNDADVEEWLEGQLDGVLGEKGIYNGKERYKANGDRKSFESLHYPVTLENIVRVMKESPERGGDMWGVTPAGLQSVSTPEYSSIAELKQDSGRLGSDESESYKAKVEAVDGQINDAISQIRKETKAHADNEYEECDIIASVMLQAAGKKTAAAIRRTFAGEGYDISLDTAKRLQTLYRGAAQLPTEYFEAKPRRAVGFDEVKAAILPNNVSNTVRSRLEKLGVPVIEYKAGDEDARLKALNSVEDVKFSRKKQTAAEQIVSEATEKEQLKKQLTAAETEKRELARKYTKARESADYWRQETQLSGGHLMDKKAVQKTASEFIDKYGSRYGKRQLAGELERAFSKISKDGASTEEALETLTNIARGVLKESTVKDTTLRDYYAPVRDWLKNTTFEIRKNSPEYGDLMSEFGDGADGTHSWANVRKNTFGRVSLKLVGEDVTGNLDTAMMEMADNWPTIFDAEAAPVDNIRNALGVYEASQVQYHDSYGNDLDTAAALAGQELMDAYLATPTRETRADKAAAQLNQTRTALRAEQKAALAAQKAAYEVRVKALESDQSAQKAKLRAKWIETTRKAAQANNTKVAERLNRQAEGYKAQLMRMDTPDYKKMQKQLLNQRAAFETLNERRKDTILLDRARDSVQKNVKQLYKWLAKPNEAGHVQTRMEKAVYDLLGKIDPSTSARGTKSDIRWQETMKDIRQMAQQSLDADKGLNDADDYADFDPDLPNMISELIDDVGDIDLHKLNGRQTQQLADILTSMKTSILNANKMMADGRGKAVQTVAEGSILDMQSVKVSQLKNRNALLGKAADTRAGDMAAQLLGLDMMDARRYFSSLGSVAENDVYKPIRDGFDKRVWKLDAAQKKFAEIKGDADISKWTGDKAERQTFKLADGNEIALTVGQRMEIYNLTQRQQAHEHLVKGGISIMEDGKKKKRVRLTPGDLADITSSLTNEQVQMARRMAAYLSATDGPAGWGNEVTQKLYGLNKFTESYYWPIKTDSNYTRTSDATAGDTPGLYAIKNQGFTKALQRKANNPLIINDAFDTWCDHVANMATYNAWAIPLSDAMKWYNYHGENEISTKEAIDGVYGAKGKKFFQTLMQDINGVSAAPSQTGYGRLTKTMVRNWKVAKVGANLRVAIQQPTAYTRAAAAISPKYLTAALAYDVGRLKQGMERAESHCAIAKWKSWGYFETNIGQTMKSVLTGERDTLDKVREISTMGAEWGDKITWGTLWNACELEARDKGMKPGSQESLDYCAARLSEIVDKTQVVDSVLHRSQIMRSKDMLTQMATNFLAEPTKTFSMIAEAAEKVAHREKGAWANMGRVLATHFVTTFGTAAAAGLIDAMRVGGDDKDKDFKERYLDALWDGFVDNINLLNNIPMVKDVISIFDGYDATRTDMEAATDVYNAVVAWQKFLAQDPNSNVTPYKLIYKTANAIADATGIPVGTAVREVKSAYDMVTALQDPLHVDETFTDTNAKLNSRLMRGQMDEAQDVLDKLVQNKIDSGKTSKEARSAVRSSLTSKWKPLYLAAEDAQRAEIASKLLALRVNGEALYTQKDLSKWVEDSKKKEKK